MTAGRAWSSEEDRALAELYPRMGNREVARELEAMGYARSTGSITYRAKKLGIAKDREAGYRKPMPRRSWTAEMDEWFVAFVPGHEEFEIAREFEREFGVRLKRSQIKNAKTRLGVRSGTHGGQFAKGLVPANKGKTWDEMGLSPETQEAMRATCFKPGQVPHNAYHQLLDERVDRYGTWVYVRPRNRRYGADDWVSKQRFVWMQANGRDWPDGCRAVFADRDRNNLDPGNIVPVPSDLYPIVQGAVRGQVPYHDRESLMVAIASARVTQARERLRKRTRESRREKRCTH